MWVEAHKQRVGQVGPPFRGAALCVCVCVCVTPVSFLSDVREMRYNCMWRRVRLMCPAWPSVSVMYVHKCECRW
jgi:hypothetical protein